MNQIRVGSGLIRSYLGATDLYQNNEHSAGAHHRSATVDQEAACWNCETLSAALHAATAAFEHRVPEINALNVFPVPDGDTGTNMHLTLQAICQEIDAQSHPLPDHVGEFFKIITRGALMGARGNSGVILYQIFAGIGEGAKDEEFFSGHAAARGFSVASQLAYRAVNNPVEGTMLSVISAVADRCQEYENRDASLLEVLSEAEKAAAEAVERTPDQLPVLRQAGVVDAGGQGLLTLIAELRQFASGELDTTSVRPSETEPTRFAAAMHFLDQAEVIHGLEEFGYCINFAVTGENLEQQGIRETLDAIGDSTVIVGDDTLMKVHTHSEHPGTILEAALTFGELHDIRIDNMKWQTERLLSERHAAVEPYHFEPPSELDVRIGIVAVGAGDGIVEALRGMGAQAVVSGGSSMNPSTGEIREAIDSLGLSEVIVLPNDSNIIASARHAAEMSEADVRVVPTTSVQQGIAALAAFNFEASLEENEEAMEESSGTIRSLALTRARRDASIDGLDFREGEFMGMVDGTPRVTGAEASAVVADLFREAGASDYDLATIFIGQPADESMVEQIESWIVDEFPDLEVEIANGGQPHYDLLISLE